MAETPGQVSIDTEDAARASTVASGLADMRHDLPPFQHRGESDHGAERVDERQPVQPGLGQHVGPGLPGDGGQEEHGRPCTVRTTASTSQPPASLVKPDLTPMTPSSPSSGV